MLKVLLDAWGYSNEQQRHDPDFAKFPSAHTQTLTYPRTAILQDNSPNVHRNCQFIVTAS